MILHPTRVHGAFLIELTTFGDDRGSFTEVYQLRALAERGWSGMFVRSAISHNHKRGTVRGLHFQRAPHSEAKLVSCIRGAVYDVMADVRPDSPTFGQWDAYELTPDNGRALFLPEGVAHGYQALCDESTDPEHKRRECQQEHRVTYSLKRVGGGVLGRLEPSPSPSPTCSDRH